MISESTRSEVLRKVNDKIEDLLTYKVENKVSIKYKGKDLLVHREDAVELGENENYVADLIMNLYVILESVFQEYT